MARLQWFLVVVYALIGAIVGVAAVWGARRSQGAGQRRYYAAFMLGNAAWCVLTAAQLAVDDPGVVLVVLRVKYLAAHAIPAGVLLFVFHYTNREARLSRPLLAGILAVPAAMWAVILTDPLHGQFVAGATLRTAGVPFPVVTYRRGPAYWVGQAVAYSLVLVAVSMLVRFMLGLARETRFQVGVLVVTTLVAAGTNMAYEFTALAIDVTPFGYLVFAAAVVSLLQRHHFLDLPLVARDHALRTIHDPVVVVDPDGRVADANVAARELLGEDVVERRASAVLPDAVADLLDRSPPVETEVELPGDGGDPRHFLVRVRPVVTRLEKRLGDLVVLHEVTGRKRRERELERQNERLEQFAGVVSHDLRNPLTVARGHLREARKDGGDERLEIVEEELDRMDDMIDEVLTLARQGESVGETEPVSLAGTAREAWGHVDTGDATLDLRVSGTAVADRDRLLTVFENLFRNAVEHAGEDVTVAVGDLEGGFYVADDGPGIPPEDRGEVFDHGYTTDPSGTGFGLSIVADVARAHGWEVDVEDAEGGGARFEFAGVDVRRDRSPSGESAES